MRFWFRGMPRFLSTPSARRATSDSSARKRPCENFYPRPPRGGRHAKSSSTRESGIFLSTPSARRATRRLLFLLLDAGFLSTPSARRATSRPAYTALYCSYFYPRPPRGGRPALLKMTFYLLYKFLSTPSARRATIGQSSINAPSVDFYPRPPRGGRRFVFHGAYVVQAISIHALREEGDVQAEVFRLHADISIHALREEGDVLPQKSVRHEEISIHALREEGDQTASPCNLLWVNFYPRPPRGGRRTGGSLPASC